MNLIYGKTEYFNVNLWKLALVSLWMKPEDALLASCHSALAITRLRFK